MKGKQATSLCFLGLVVLVLYCPPLPVKSNLAFTLIEVKPEPLIRTWDIVSLIYPGQFHDPDAVQEEIDLFHETAPELIDMEVIGQSIQGRNITCLRITNENNDWQKAKTLVVTHHHGREQITVEMTLRFLIYLLNGYGIDSAITEYIDTEEIYVIPTLNPDALELVVNQDSHWLRKNLRPFDNDADGLFDEDPEEDTNGDGCISSFDVYTKSGSSLEFQYAYFEGIDNDGDGSVNEDEIGLTDLNRNYDSYWGGTPGSSNDPTSQIYRGASPFSEPETSAFRDFVLQHRFAMAYSLHSGINCTYFPTDRDNYWLDPFLFSQVLNDYNGLLPDGYNEIYDRSEINQENRGVVSQLAAGQSGMWMDWMYNQHAVPLPICFEIYHNASSDIPSSYTIIEDNATHQVQEWKEIYGYFNPVASHIDALWDDLLPSFRYLLDMTPRITPTLLSASPQGDNIAVQLNIECLSPRLSTVDPIQFLTPTDTLLHSIPAIAANSFQTVTFTIPSLQVAIGETIQIGNEYSGYLPLELVESSPIILPNPFLIAAGLGVVVVSAIIVFIIIRVYKKRNARIQ